jgi:hypothetical protein
LGKESRGRQTLELGRRNKRDTIGRHALVRRDPRGDKRRHSSVRRRQNPGPEFRVIAGTKPGTSASGAGVINWQPHTLCIGKDGVLQWPLAKAHDEMALRVEADGCRPAVTEWIKRSEGAKDITLTLAEDGGIQGRALTPNGKPAAASGAGELVVAKDGSVAYTRGYISFFWVWQPPPRVGIRKP